MVQQGTFCSQTSFGYKNKFMQSRKINSLSFRILQGPLQTCHWFVGFCIHKKYQADSVVAYAYNSVETNALVVENDGVCCALCRLQRVLEYLQATAVQVTFKVIYFELKSKGMCIIISSSSNFKEVFILTSSQNSRWQQ